MAPLSTRNGTSAASHGARPRHSACATPKCGLHVREGEGGRPRGASKGFGEDGVA